MQRTNADDGFGIENTLGTAGLSVLKTSNRYKYMADAVVKQVNLLSQRKTVISYALR